MSERESVPRGFESPYEQFLWKELTIIRECEREGKYYQALSYVISLLNYISPQIRKQLAEEGKSIMNRVNYVINKKKSFDYYNTLLERNRIAKLLGQQYLEKFLAILSNSLAERLYMEKPSFRFSMKDFKDLEESEGLTEAEEEEE